ncbi:hypothetical protein Hanom_Chr16g01441841 [Helianthus anomalus]
MPSSYPGQHMPLPRLEPSTSEKRWVSVANWATPVGLKIKKKTWIVYKFLVDINFSRIHRFVIPTRKTWIVYNCFIILFNQIL